MSGTLLVIPARYASTRYPGKPLVELTGATGKSASLIARSFAAGQGLAGVDRVVVATDDARIEAAAKAFGAEVVMTSTTCRNGTERCAEVAAKLPGYDLIVNLQGDAPLTPPWFIEALIAAMKANPSFGMATPVLRRTGAMRQALIDERAAGRVGGTTAVFASDGHALYFSKEVIPFSSARYGATDETPVFHHVGVYAYRPESLAAYAAWPPCESENLEGLEQLRFLDRGENVLCVPVEARGREFWELNNPSDVAIIEAMMKKMAID